jgi:hypothetical protein
MARQGPNETIKAVEFLEGRPTKVFHRIAFDIIRRQRQVVPDLVAAHLTNHAFFDDASLRHEYDHLACEAFGQLSPPQQNAILTWIEQGPPPSTHERWEQHAGQQHPAENWELYTKYWQLDRLTPIADSLPSSWHERYRQLIAEIGPVPPVPQEGYLDTSPVTQEDLARMTPQAILDYLRGWEPGEREHVLSREGLGRALAGVVAENPTQFDTLTIQLRTLHPTYVQWYFRGLREAIQKGRTCTWQVALDLAGWAAAEHDARKTEDLVTRDGATWRDTGSVIADVLTFAVTKTPDIIPYRHREQVWQVLSTFVEDPEPTPQYELEYGPPNMEPYTLALNSTRGKAMEAVIQYALWVRRARNDEYRGFDDLSEVRAVLDQHLDPVHDSSLAIRSVYGRFFPWIVLLDQDWAAERAKTIFDGELGQAAWEAYLTYCPVYDDTAKLLTGQYDQAITTLAKAPPKSRPQNDTANHLGQHLIARYWRGQLALDQGLFARFFAEAPEDLRAAAIRFAGRALSNTEGTVDAEVLRRLTTFWVSRRQIANSALDRHRRELAGFGFWFASGKLDDEWALQQLRDILALVHTIDDDFLVLQQLAKLAAVFPLATVECLAAFAPGDQNYWRIMASEKEVRSVLRTALAGEDHVAQRAARDLVNRLGALGYSGYRTILQ